MNNKVLGVLAFSLGAAAGVAVSWRYFKTKYERIAQEEIESVKELYSEKAKQEKTKKVEEDRKESILEQQSYREKITELQYVDPVDIPEDEAAPKPYVIAPEDFGALSGYQTESLTYYADGILADDGGNPIDEVVTVGADFADHFGDYEDDAVHIRNEASKTDYEILMDVRRFAAYDTESN